jgi:amidase
MQPIDLAFAAAWEQARMVRDRVVSAREVVEATLEMIHAQDTSLNAFRVVLAEHALAEATKFDSAKDRTSSPLAGVPVAIKDDTDVAGVATSIGTGLIGPAAAEDAPVVARLRRAGAIVIGKTNVPELDLWPLTSSASHGETRNPWDLSRTPGGSSGGSAVAVAAGMCGLPTAAGPSVIPRPSQEWSGSSRSVTASR